MNFIDGDRNILVPKSVRPIIEYDKTILGSRNNAKKQYRYRNLHIREYNDYYSLHMDRADPRQDPIGHLIKDAPEEIVYLILAFSFGSKIGRWYYNKKKNENIKTTCAISSAAIMGTLTGITAYHVSKCIYSFMKKSNQINIED